MGEEKLSGQSQWGELLLRLDALLQDLDTEGGVDNTVKAEGLNDWAKSTISNGYLPADLRSYAAYANYLEIHAECSEKIRKILGKLDEESSREKIDAAVYISNTLKALKRLTYNIKIPLLINTILEIDKKDKHKIKTELAFLLRSLEKVKKEKVTLQKEYVLVSVELLVQLQLRLESSSSVKNSKTIADRMHKINKNLQSHLPKASLWSRFSATFSNKPENKKKSKEESEGIKLRPIRPPSPP